MSIESVMPSSHLILGRPLLCHQSLPASVFSNESTLRMRWPKYWNLQAIVKTSRSGKDQKLVKFTHFSYFQPQSNNRPNYDLSLLLLKNMKSFTNGLTYKRGRDSQTQKTNLQLPGGRDSQDGHVNTIIFKINNQQEPTLQHREFYYSATTYMGK